MRPPGSRSPVSSAWISSVPTAAVPSSRTMRAPGSYRRTRASTSPSLNPARPGRAARRGPRAPGCPIVAGASGGGGPVTEPAADGHTGGMGGDPRPDRQGRDPGNDEGGDVETELDGGPGDLAPLGRRGQADIGRRRDRGHRHEDPDQGAAAGLGQRQHADDAGQHGHDHGQAVGVGDERRELAVAQLVGVGRHPGQAERQRGRQPLSRHRQPGRQTAAPAAGRRRRRTRATQAASGPYSGPPPSPR